MTPPPPARGATDTTRMPRWLAIALVSLAGLLLEVGYTRIVSYKLWYYYTYLVIGLALLGIGSGGVIVAIVRSRCGVGRPSASSRVCSIGGAISIAIGYSVIARAADRHRRDLGLRHRVVGQEPRAARRHLLHAVRHVHRDRRHHLRAARSRRRRRRPPLLRRPRRCGRRRACSRSRSSARSARRR